MVLGEGEPHAARRGGANAIGREPVVGLHRGVDLEVAVAHFLHRADLVAVHREDWHTRSQTALVHPVFDRHGVLSLIPTCLARRGRLCCDRSRRRPPDAHTVVGIRSAAMRRKCYAAGTRWAKSKPSSRAKAVAQALSMWPGL